MVINQNPKELFLKVMNFEPCSRTLNWDFAYWAGAIFRWYKEGLPKIKGIPEDSGFGKGIRGPGGTINSPSFGGVLPVIDFDIAKYFDFDNGIATAPYHYWIYPRFDEKIISEDERYIEIFGNDGIRKKILKDDSSMPFWLEWPVKDRKDWEKIKEERFNLDSINQRFASNFDDFLKKVKDGKNPINIFDPPVGFFGCLRSLFGEKNLYMLYYDDPLLLKDILDHLCNFWINIAEELTSKIDFDMASFFEDMAGKQGPIISPSTFREFMSPYYKKLIGFLKSKKIKLFLVDSDGYIENLIPLFLETRINILIPFEQQAGNDLLKIRKKYPHLGMMGGFDKNSLSKGISFIEKELEKIPHLIKKGGYIPYSDHDVPPNVSWENYKYYRKRLEEIIFSTKVL